MKIQDIIFFVGTWIFVAALIPTILSRDKPPLKTSLTTAIVSNIFVINYITLGLYLSALAMAGATACWYVLAYQRFHNDKKDQSKDPSIASLPQDDKRRK